MKKTNVWKSAALLLLALAMVLPSCGINGGTVTETSNTAEPTETHTEVIPTETESSSRMNTESTHQEATESTTEKISESESKTVSEETTEKITDVITGETLDAQYADEFSVSRVFSDNMIVQRNEHIRVWGFAPESENGKKISGKFKGMFAEAIVQNGEWCLTFGARLEADVKGTEMTIYTDKKTVTFKDVLVGDVYMVIGQSNVEYNVNTHIANTNAQTQGGGVDAIDPNSIIRLNRTNNSSGGNFAKKGTDYVYRDLLNTKQWTKTTQNDTLQFSAIGYYFAKQLVEKTENKIPVGIIEIGFSGAPLGSYLPNEVAEAYDTDYLNPLSGTYMTTGVNSNSAPGRYIYNCHIAPFENYAIAGIVWYQGESNNSAVEAAKYNSVFTALMTYMRDTHNLVHRDFPVFIIEFPSIYKKPADHTSTWHFMELGMIRSFMGSIPISLNNSYVSSSSDLWNDKTFFNSLHPNCKYEQAERLADLAFSVVHGKVELAKVSGPILKSVELSADQKSAVLTFENVGKGLTTTDGGTQVKGIVGIPDKPFLLSSIKPVSATITAPDQITVTFNKQIKAVAYNFDSEDHFGHTVNLCNSDKFPATAFMTPYTEKYDLTSFEAKDFVKDSAAVVKKKGKAIDSLVVDGENLLPVGQIENKLSQVNNTVEIFEKSTTLSVSGWVGFEYELIMLGYSVDGGKAVFNASPATPQAAVINAGGALAKRFAVGVNVALLEKGAHTVDIVALIDLNEGGTAVTLLSFKLIVTERPPEPVAPEGLELPLLTDEKYKLVRAAYDVIDLDGIELYRGQYSTKLSAAGNVVKAKKGTNTVGLQGWVGFESALDCFGYVLDGTDPVIESAPVGTESAVLQSGGENARRYKVIVDISSLEVGLHTVQLVVRLHDADSTVLQLISFTLEITE